MIENVLHGKFILMSICVQFIYHFCHKINIWTKGN